MSVADPVIDRVVLTEKRIYLRSSIREYHPVTDIYVEIRNLRRIDESLRVFDMPVTGAGAVPKGGGKFTPRYAVFNHGWKIVPENIEHQLYVSGEQITDDGQSGAACIDISQLDFSVVIQYEPPAAELIQAAAELAAIQDLAYAGAVSIDSEGSNTGTYFPQGTVAYPCSLYSDAKEIDAVRKYSKYRLVHDLVLDTTDMYDNYTFSGAGQEITKITIPTEATITDCRFEYAEVQGTLEGNSVGNYCLFKQIAGLRGKFYNCMLGPGTIKLNANGIAHFIEPVSGVPGTDTAIIDFNETGAVTLRGLIGGIKLMNMDGLTNSSIDLHSGQVKIDMPTMTRGTIVIRGVGKVIDADTDEHIYTGSYGQLNIINETISVEKMLEYMWSSEEAVQLLSDTSFTRQIEGGRWKIDSNQMIFFGDDNITEIARFDLFSNVGAPTSTNPYERVRV